MVLPIKPPFEPMEARLVDVIPAGEGWQYEPKWDGFRCLAFRDGGKVELQSKSGQPLARYFPELVEALLALKAQRFVLDGEIVIPVGAGRLSFDDLLMRIHPAATRVSKLATEHPARLMVFDLLVDECGRSLVGEPLQERRVHLERFAQAYLRRHEQVHLSPATQDLRQARQWMGTVGGTGGQLDGIIAKRLDMTYHGGDRTAMQKVKHVRTADCVVGGYRKATSGDQVGSLLLGLYDRDGLLHHVGFTSSFTAVQREEVARKVEETLNRKRGSGEEVGFSGRAPGGPSRWSTERSSQWVPLPPRLVVEVQYDHFTGGRFRHGTKLLRWRPDKSPGKCGMDQVVGK